MNKPGLRLIANRIALGLAVLAILAGLIVFGQWAGVWLNATLL